VNSRWARSGEFGDRWQRTHPTRPVGEDGFDLGLLQHDLGNPDGVRVFGPPPREVPGVRIKPCQQRFNDSLLVHPRRSLAQPALFGIRNVPSRDT
jgi:hypothetical protein